MAVFGFVSGLAGICVYAWTAEQPQRIVSILFLVGMASWLGGALLGFLFGMPRFAAPAIKEDTSPPTVRSRVIENNNLHEISDWLTKIIIGATLADLGDISTGFSRLIESIAGQLRTPAAHVVAGSVVLLYFFTGLMWGYLWYSIRIHEVLEAREARRREAEQAGHGETIRR